MPCYQVQVCNVELNAADHKMLGKALEKAGYKVVRGKDGQILSFSKGKVTGSYNGKRLNLTAPRGVKIDSDEIKRGYSRQVILKKVDEARNKGWNVDKEGEEWVFRKPQARTAQVHA